jgi:MFS transporter, DHA2 family, multidrug resistance protein
MNRFIIAIAVILPTLIEVIDTTVVNVSLAHIRGSLSAGFDEATWAITAYLISNAIIIPMTGWLSRLFGRKKFLIFSISLFTVSSLMCGMSTSLSMLIFFRILQGFGGGALQPISQAILFETFPPRQHGMAMAIFGIGVMFGPIIGPILGGWITDNWSWRWIFYINIPICIFSIAMITWFIKDPPYLKRIKAHIDWYGLGLIAVGLGCLQIILDKGQNEDWFNSPFILRLAVISAACLISFIFVELNSKEPIVNLRAFKNRSFASGNCIQFLAFGSMFGSIVLLPLFVQQLLGYNAFLAGLVLAPGGIATLFSLPLAGKLVNRVNPRYILITGVGITAYSTLIMSAFNLNVDFNTITISRVLMGFGMGLIFVPLTNMTLSSIPKEDMGNGTSIFNLLRNLGGSIGTAFFMTMLAQRGQFHQARFAESANALNPMYQISRHQAAAALAARGLPAQGANGVIYQNMLAQAGMGAYADTFFACFIILLCIIPLAFVIQRPKHHVEGVAVH